MRSLVLAATLVLSGTVAASAQTCREYARDAADRWAAPNLVVAGAADQPLDDEVVVIAAGKKYFVPRVQDTVMPQSVGTRIRERNAVYNEEYWRCVISGAGLRG